MEVGLANEGLKEGGPVASGGWEIGADGIEREAAVGGCVRFLFSPVPLPIKSI